MAKGRQINLPNEEEIRRRLDEVLQGISGRR